MEQMGKRKGFEWQGTKDFQTTRGELKKWMKEDYENVVKSFVSIETRVWDEKVLDEAYQTYMHKDSMSLLNKEFLDVVKSISKKGYQQESGFEEDWELER